LGLHAGRRRAAPFLLQRLQPPVDVDVESRWRLSLFSVSKRSVSISPRNEAVSARSCSSCVTSCVKL
jgi:hypothetical protein